MPYVEIKLSINLDDNKKNDLQLKLTQTIALAFSKPKMYVMVNILDSSSLFMGGKKLEKGAYISVSLLGSTTKSTCQNLTKDICNILNSDLELNKENIYITYHSVDLWGWNGSMF
jgi:phenylpyruvate tautomerase PptA (4-oxalocrotonate tautomerase family)